MPTAECSIMDICWPSEFSVQCSGYFVLEILMGIRYWKENNAVVKDSEKTHL